MTPRLSSKSQKSQISGPLWPQKTNTTRKIHPWSSEDQPCVKICSDLWITLLIWSQPQGIVRKSSSFIFLQAATEISWVLGWARFLTPYLVNSVYSISLYYAHVSGTSCRSSHRLEPESRHKCTAWRKLGLSPVTHAWERWSNDRKIIACHITSKVGWNRTGLKTKSTKLRRHL